MDSVFISSPSEDEESACKESVKEKSVQCIPQPVTMGRTLRPWEGRRIEVPPGYKLIDFIEGEALPDIHTMQAPYYRGLYETMLKELNYSS